MSWTLVARTTTDSEPQTFPLPVNTTAHIVFNKDFGSVAVLSELPHNIECSELGRITAGPWGVKLEAINDPISITSGQTLASAATNRTIVKYQLQPRLGEHSEVLILRHGDVISSPNIKTNLTCMWNSSPEIQVNSSAAEASVQAPKSGVDAVGETPLEEETEDEDLDDTTTAVKATQSKSQQPQATPQLSNQRSVVIQETPTAARTKSVTNLAVNPDMEVDEAEPVADQATEETAHQAEVGLFSTAHTGESQQADIKALQSPKVLPEESVSALAETITKTLNGNSNDIRPKGRYPKVVVKKRSSPALDEPDSGSEPISRSSKRTKRTIPNDYDTEDCRSSNIVVDASPKHAPASKGKKRKSTAKDLEDFIEAASPQSQRGSQRLTATPTAEPYDGETPRIATSNSSITDKSQAVKFLKKKGGSLVDSVKDPFNVLCVRDGDLHKTPKVLRAIAAGIPIVTDKWLSDSAKAGHFLSVHAYMPLAPKQEKAWNFNLADVFSQPQTPFDGYTVHFTSAAHAKYKIFTEIEHVCKAAGAEKVTKKKLDKSQKVVVFAMEEDDKEAEKLAAEGVRCYARDLLPTSIFRGTLDLDSDEFRIGAETASTAKGTKGKRSRKD